MTCRFNQIISDVDVVVVVVVVAAVHCQGGHISRISESKWFGKYLAIACLDLQEW